MCRPNDLGATEIELWSRFEARAGLDSPFLSPEYAQAVGSVFPSARVAVIHDGEGLVGFLAYSLERFGAATAISDGMASLSAFIPAPGCQWTLQEVVRAAGLHLFSFQHLVAAQSQSDGTTRENNNLTIDLSQRLEHYLATVHEQNGTWVSEVERKSRSLQRNDPESRFDLHEPSALSKLFEWKSAQLRAQGKIDIFARRGVRTLVERLAFSTSAAMQGSVSCLWSNGLLAAIVSIRSSTVLETLNTAYNSERASHSPDQSDCFASSRHPPNSGCARLTWECTMRSTRASSRPE